MEKLSPFPHIQVCLYRTSAFTEFFHCYLIYLNNNNYDCNGKEFNETTAVDRYLSNRPQVFMDYKLINHTGCW